jgi:DNA-binding Xre family transcriptional regulator
MMVYLNIEAILKEKGKSKYWFMKEMGNSYTNLNKLYKSSVKQIRFSTLERLCEVLDCDFNTLLKVREDS